MKRGQLNLKLALVFHYPPLLDSSQGRIVDVLRVSDKSWGIRLQLSL